MKNLLLFISCLAFFTAAAQVNVFTGAIDTNWNNPNNWSLVTLPSPTTDVQISNGKTALLNIDTSVNSIHLQGTAVLIIQANINIGSLQESNTAPLSTISWGSGNIGGGGTLNILGLLDIIPGGKKIVGGATINLSGRMYQDNDWGIDIANGTFSNQPEGEIEMHGSQRDIYGTGTGSHLFYNYGLFKKTGDGVTRISANLHNSGTITVQSGWIELLGTDTVLNNGNYNTAFSTSLVFGGTQTLSGILSGNNLGDIHWSGTMNVPVTAEINFLGNGTFNWGNGHLTGGGILINSGLLSMTGAYYGTKYIEGGTVLNNTGTIRIQTDWSLDITDGTLNNLPSGIIDINISQVQIMGSGAGNHSFNNSGTILKSYGVGNAQINAVLNNTGTITVEAGSIIFNNATTTLVGGTYNTLPGCYIFNSAPVTCSGTLTGTLDGNFNWTSDIIVPTTATFNFIGSGLNNWAAGTIRGGGTLTNDGVFEFSGSWVGQRFIAESTTLQNNNTIRITSDQAITMNGGTINNPASGIIDIQFPAGLYAGSGTNSINNVGQLKKTAVGTCVITVPINNIGTIDVSSGGMQLGLLNNATSGIVKGTGTLYLPTAANFTNNGTFAPGGEPGNLTLNGNYLSNTNTRLNVQLYGMGQGTGYDTMTMQNNAIMAGTIVPELHFDPAIGSSFIVGVTLGTITSCGLASTATATYGGQQYTFNVGCQDDNKVVLTLAQKTLANEVFNLDKQIVLAPNPARNFILIKNNSNMVLNEAQISDASGRIIAVVKPDNNDNRIDLSSYSPGLYFMRLNIDQGNVVKRFIVK